MELETFFSKYECSEHLISEYRNRALGFKPNQIYRCPKSMSGNIFYADVSSGTTVRVYKYSTQWNEVKTIEQAAPSCVNFNLAFHGGKLYILGGKIQYKNTYSEAVCILQFYNLG